MDEAIVHGQLGDIAHRTLRVAEAGSDAREFFIADVDLGRGAGVALEQNVQ
ncbi:hypothetical protein D3C78_1644090 [compost metagenome]